MNLFGKRKPSSSAPSGGGGASTKDAIARLREAEEQLTKREEHLMRKADHELAEAKKFAADKNKRSALTALKRKKLYEAQLEKVSASKMTLDMQRMALEQINISKVTFDAIDVGKRELERLNKEMGVERVEETMDDLQEQIELTNETADALARPLGGMGIGEDEVRSRSTTPRTPLPCSLPARAPACRLPTCSR
ncbi:Snf7-domain-containing protein [Pavlovales sp. CCMP2436]|nr:Snf7-domain-containing protein [Pavlovales sp. CCMP2436]